MREKATLLGILVLLMQPEPAAMGAETLAQRLKQLRDGGQPTKIRELAPKPIAHSRNAAAQLADAEKLIGAFSADSRDFHNSRVGREYAELEEMGLPPTTEQLEVIRKILARHAELDKQIRRAWRCEEYASQLDFSLSRERFFEAMNGQIRIIRMASRFVEWQMLAAAGNGELDKALADGVSLLRLVRLQENEPAMGSYLVTIACRQVACNGLNQVLRWGPLSLESRDALDAELKRQSGLSHLVEVLRTERAIGLDGGQGWRGAVMALSLGDWQLDLLNFYEAELKRIDKPWHRGRGLIGNTAGYHPIVRTLIPAVKGCYGAANRDLAVQRCLRILNALGRFRQDHGREAQSLAELNLPAAVTTDPYTGRALLLKMTDRGWLIYSAFENEVDDNGSLSDHKDWGLGP